MRKLVFYILLLSQNLGMYSQEKKINLLETIALDSNITFDEHFEFLDNSQNSIKIFMERKELLCQIESELSKLRKKNKYYKIYDELMKIIKKKNVVYKSDFETELYLESFYYLVSELIDNAKVKICINNIKALEVRKYEKTESLKSEGKYSSYFIYKVLEIEIFSILNYVSIE